MEILHEVSEDEMILEFLSAELESERFNEKLQDTLTKLNIDAGIIKAADIKSAEENTLRKQIMADYRGYGINQHLFENFPEIKQWVYAMCSQDDIDKIHYTNYSYWNELSKNTSLPRVAAQTINEGVQIFGIPNDNAIHGVKYLQEGNTFRPVILITSDFDEYIIIEGHSRMTVYGLLPEKFDKPIAISEYAVKVNEKHGIVMRNSINSTTG